MDANIPRDYLSNGNFRLRSILQNLQVPLQFCNGLGTIGLLFWAYGSLPNAGMVLSRPNSEVQMMTQASAEHRRSVRTENDSQRSTKDANNGVIGRRLLNVREAAQYLGLEVDTVYKKSRLREVPCVKVGRALRFDVRALERYIEKHSIETID